jgi:predicted nucleotidyltransferase
LSEIEHGAVDAAWLDQLPADLHQHAQILRSLLHEAEKDERVVAVQVQGSVGRGEADRFSDLDIGIVVVEDSWPAVTEEVPALVHRIAQVVDEHYYFLPDAQSAEVFRAWAHLPDGIQLDLLLLPESRLLGSGPDGRTLMDRDRRLLRTDHPKRTASRADIEGWVYLCWQNLTEAIKYLERGRPLAAAEWLTSARQSALSCWAAANGMDYAVFTNVVAARLGVSGPWPDGLQKAYPNPDRGSVIEAAIALAAIQSEADELLQLKLGIPPRPLAAWVRERLVRLR